MLLVLTSTTSIFSVRCLASSGCHYFYNPIFVVLISFFVHVTYSFLSLSPLGRFPFVIERSQVYLIWRYQVLYYTLVSLTANRIIFSIFYWRISRFFPLLQKRSFCTIIIQIGSLFYGSCYHAWKIVLSCIVDLWSNPVSLRNWMNYSSHQVRPNLDSNKDEDDWR